MPTPAQPLPSRGDADWYDYATALHNAVDTSLDKAGDTMTGALTVLAPTASGHPSRITAIDASTGQLQLEGVEIGDTGWRDMSGSFEVNWSGDFKMRRVGNLVTAEYRMVPAASAANQFLIIGAGFRVDKMWTTSNENVPLGACVATGVTGAQAFLSLNATGDTAPSLTRFRFCGSNLNTLKVVGDTYLGQTTWTTNDSWPSSLPGVAV